MSSLSLMEEIANMPIAQQQLWISALDDKQIIRLMYDWEAWARPSQRTPEKDFYVWLLLAGRGFGKTRTGAEQIIKWKNEGFRKFAFVAKTPADARDVMIYGESGICTIAPPWDMPKYVKDTRSVTWDNGAQAIIYSDEVPDQLRGANIEKAWVDELAKFRYPQDTWDNLKLSLRSGIKPQVIITTTPKPTKTLKEIMADELTVITRGTTYENRSNLAQVFIDQVIKKYEGTRLGRQELYAEVLDDNPNALWNRNDIEKGRLRKCPDLVRIVIAIDPAVTSTEESDETGIVVGGLDAFGHGYVLEDGSCLTSPDKWARKSVELYNKWSADRIVGEANNGGDMIETIIRQHQPSVAYSKVWATRGKYVRAEPIASLYEQGKVHHIGSFPELEDELCTWEQGEKSPNRLDALVWCMTELMLPKKGRLKVDV